MHDTKLRSPAFGLGVLLLATFGFTSLSAAEVQVAAPEPCATALDVALTPALAATAAADGTDQTALPAVSASPFPVSAALAGAAGSPLQQLSPTDVALGSPLASNPGSPPPPSFPGIDACDDPGSGCMGQLVPTALPPTPPSQPSSLQVIVPPPVSPCGAPGFPCR